MMTDSKKEQLNAGLIGLTYSPDEIGDKTREIYYQVLASSKNINQGNFTKIGTVDIRHLFELYDRSFFDNLFTTRYFPDLEDLGQTISSQFELWQKPNETIRRLCAII